MEQARITSHQGTPAAQAARGKPAVQGKDSLADTQGGAATGGFMALLASLGDDGLQDTLAPQPTVEEPFSIDPATTTDAAAQTALAGGLLSWQWQATIAGGAAQGYSGQGGGVHDSTGAPGATRQGLTLPGFAGQGLAESGLTAVQVAGPAIGLGALADAAANLTPSDGPLPEGSLLLQTALQDAAVAGDGRGAAVEMQGAAGKRKVLGRLAAGVAPASDAGSAAGAQSTGQAGTKGQGVSLAQGASFQPLVVERRDASDQAREGSRHMEAGIDGAPAVLAQWASDTAAGVRGVARGGDSGASVSGAGGAVEPSQERPVGLAGEVGTEFVDPAMAGTEDAVAEQVAYWVHQNIQNAKLTVKHDGQPVEVSVSLTGNEAHVSFGSDEAQTRDLIDGSVAQLRDMLRQEGLVLSGVTVGESGSRQGDEGAGGQKNPQRQTGVVVPAAVATPAAGRVNVLGDRAVDIFV